jgi:F0F1-type ATP synthase assembly protein I
MGMVALWVRFMGVDAWMGFSQYTLVTFIVSIAAGLFSAKTAGTEIMGLTERLVVTANVQYFF